MKTALVVMAAGIGSRFGGGIKQLEPVGLHGEVIMDYSIHDAIEAGFNKIVFIIRKDLQEAFKEIIGDRIEALCEKLGIEVAYVFQELSAIPKGMTCPANRQKPWGTGQAVLACKGVVTEPFAVINADDYYGKEAFVKLHDFLLTSTKERAMDLCMAGFVLKNTLSDNGGVTRGVCRMDDKGYLTGVDETSGIEKVVRDGVICAQTVDKEIDADSLVSMNMWGLTPAFIDLLDRGFVEFFEEIQGDPEKQVSSEYLLPIYIDRLLKKGQVTVKVLETGDKWFGVTYKEDKDVVVQSFKELIEKGIYPEYLFSDFK